MREGVWSRLFVAFAVVMVALMIYSFTGHPGVPCIHPWC